MQALNLCLPGHIDPYDSYGLIGCQLARYLTRAGIHVNVFAMGKHEMESHDDELTAIVSRPIVPVLGSVMLGYPTGYAKHENPLAHIGPRVAVTMFESSKIPPAWIDPLTACDAVVVPSRFCAASFAACGVTKPIHVVPLGVSWVYEFAYRPTNRPLTFLAFLDRGARKGGLVALQAFLRAFGDNMDYRLILKMRKPKVEVQLTNANIDVVQQDMSEEELYQLYLSADVLINPNKGEGFGLLPREFACTGGLALATDWGGTADDIDLWGMPLPYQLEPADWKGNKALQGQDLGEWAVVEPDRVADKLLTIASNRDYYRELGQVYAERARKLYSWRTFAERVLEIYQEVAVGDRTRATEIAA